MRGLFRRAGRAVLGGISEHPFRTAGAVAALAAAVVTLYGAAETSTATDQATATAVTEVPPAAVVDFAVAHPVYPATVAVGLAVVFLLR